MFLEKVHTMCNYDRQREKMNITIFTRPDNRKCNLRGVVIPSSVNRVNVMRIHDDSIELEHDVAVEIA